MYVMHEGCVYNLFCYSHFSVEDGSVTKKPPAEADLPHDPANTKDDKAAQEKEQEDEEQNKENTIDQEGKDWFDIYMTLLLTLSFTLLYLTLTLTFFSGEQKKKIKMIPILRGHTTMTLQPPG